MSDRPGGVRLAAALALLAVLDGRQHTLPPGALHTFSDGEYGGSRDLRLPAR